MMCDLEDTINVQKFPSPIGELHFSMMCISDVILYRICPSFRPLSGSYISQCRCYLLPRSNNRFPSPIGELHFSMIDGKDENGNDKSFRPLSGSYISQLFRSKQLTLFQKKVSVPYRGATFLNCGSSVYTDIEFQDCFRPLSGSYISQFFTSRYTTSSRFRPLSGSYISQSWFWLFL